MSTEPWIKNARALALLHAVEDVMRRLDKPQFLQDKYKLKNDEVLRLRATARAYRESITEV